MDISGRYYIMFPCSLPLKQLATSGLWTQKKTHPGAIRRYGVVVNCPDVLYAGTGVGAATYQDWYEYTKSTDTWASKTNYTRVTYGGTAVYVSGAIYYISGRSGSTAYKDCNKFTIATNTWSAKTDMLGVGRYLTLSWLLSGFIYVGGGRDAAGLQTVYQYNYVANTWASGLGNIPNYTYDVGYCSIGNKAYTSSQTPATVVWVEFDPVAKTWSSKANTPEARTFACFASDTTKAYMIGGTNNASVYELNCYSYTQSDNTWRPIVARCPVGRRYHSISTTLSGSFWMIWGGISTSYTNTLFKYNFIGRY